MKIAIQTAVVAGVIILLNGCNNTPSVENTQAFDLKKQHIAKHYKDAYYFKPNNSWSYKLNANGATLNNVASGGVLTCKENSIWFISNADRSEEEKIRYKYFISLSKSSLNKMREDPDFIPRRNSKEFKDLMEIDTKMAKQGLVGCSDQISQERMEKILPASSVVAI